MRRLGQDLPVPTERGRKDIEVIETDIEDDEEAENINKFRSGSQTQESGSIRREDYTS